MRTIMASEIQSCKHGQRSKRDEQQAAAETFSVSLEMWSSVVHESLSCHPHLAGCRFGHVGLLKEDFGGDRLAAGVTNSESLARLWIDEIDTDTTMRASRRRVRRHVGDHVTDAKVLHDVVINRREIRIRLDHVSAAARVLRNLLQLLLRRVPVDPCEGSTGRN